MNNLLVGTPIGPFDDPNVQIALSPTVNMWWTGFAIVLAAVCFAWAIGEIVVRRTTVLLFCLLGGVLCNLIEPILDVTGHLHFNPGNTTVNVMFTQLQAPIEYPLQAWLVYVQFGGLSTYIFYLLFKRGVSRKTFWIVLASQWVMNIALEWFLTRMHLYTYYGDHPFRLDTFPLWWIFTNLGVVLGGAMLAVLLARWGNRATPLAILIVPSAFVGWEFWAGWPVYSTLNLDTSSLVRHLAALVTAAIAIASVAALTRLLPGGPGEPWQTGSGVGAEPGDHAPKSTAALKSTAGG